MFNFRQTKNHKKSKTAREIVDFLESFQDVEKQIQAVKLMYYCPDKWFDQESLLSSFSNSIHHF